MSLDCKFQDAARGFSEGQQNPVPLALVHTRPWEGFNFVGFTNGITRTMWLLSNHAESFPVSLNQLHEAEFLNQLAGVGVDPITYEELFNCPL